MKFSKYQLSRTEVFCKKVFLKWKTLQKSLKNIHDEVFQFNKISG